MSREWARVKTPQGTLLMILAASFAAPLVAAALPKLRVPALVFEIAFGILMGPQVLNLVAITPPIEMLSNLGLAALIFMAGFELDPDRMKGTPVKLAGMGWGISVLIGVLGAVALQTVGIIHSELFLGLALTTTALGTLLPIARDAGLLPTKLGTHILAIGSFGEFGPIVAIAVLLSGTSPTRAVGALTLFAIVAVAGLLWARRPGDSAVRRVVGSTLRSSGQAYVRLSLLLVAGMAFVASQLGLDFLLGAFTAGVLFRLFIRTGATEEEVDLVEIKLEAVSFGYVIPVFFVVTGIAFDIDSLVSDPKVLALVPIFLVLYLVVRGIPILLYKAELPSRHDRKALVFFSGTALPLVVAITDLGVEAQQMRPSTAAAMVGAGMLSVVVFPLLGMRALRQGATSEILDIGVDS